MDIQLIEIDQIWQNETTNYWFKVDNEQWAISDCNGFTQLLDCEGCPTANYPAIYDALLVEYNKVLNN